MEKSKIKISVQELATIIISHELNGFKSAEFCHYVSHTTPKLNKFHRVTKEPQPWSKVTKVTTTNCSLKVIYENAINNALVRAGEQEKGEKNFVAQELPWGNWVKYSDGSRSKILIEKPEDGKMYIRTTYNNPNEKAIVIYLDENGKVIPFDLLVPFMGPKREEGPVTVRCYEIGGMKEFSLAGKIYEITK